MGDSHPVDSIKDLKQRLKVPPQGVDAESLQRDIKTGLYQLFDIAVIKDNESERFESFFHEGMKKLFAEIDKKLTFYETKYPSDKDVKILRTMFDDLKSDFDEDFLLEFDSGFEKIMNEVWKEVTDAGVKTESPDHSSIPEVVKKLKNCGIEPAYVVSSGNKNAKTIVFFAQAHPYPLSKKWIKANLRKYKEHVKLVEDSQFAIYQNLKAGIDAGLSRTVYGEGLAGGLEFSESFLKDAENGDWRIFAEGLAYSKLKKELGEKMKLIGMEDAPLQMAAVGDSKGMAYRITAHNVLLAQNISGNLSKSKENLAFAVLGEGHEFYEHEDVEEIKAAGSGNLLPFSTALAYFGYNVVVVK